MENYLVDSQASVPRPIWPGWLIPLLIATIAFGGLAIWLAHVTGEGWIRGMRKNLVLAWVPLLLALGFEHFRVKKSRARLLAMPCTVLWFLYYPNAPYLCTEFLHLYGTPDTEFWIILVLLNGYALMGLTLGYLSLEIFHTYVRQRWGTLPGWVLLAVMALFSGFGIYFGRILRLNSWHLFTRPEKLHIKLSGWLQDVPRDPRSLWFAMAFAGLIFISHCLLRGLASRETLPESRIK